MSKRIGYDANGNKVHIEDTRYICTCKECLPLPDELSKALMRWENEVRASMSVWDRGQTPITDEVHADPRMEIDRKYDGNPDVCRRHYTFKCKDCAKENERCSKM